MPEELCAQHWTATIALVNTASLGMVLSYTASLYSAPLVHQAVSASIAELQSEDGTCDAVFFYLVMLCNTCFVCTSKCN